MREINLDIVEKEVERLFTEANYILEDDLKKALDNALLEESSIESKNVLEILKENYLTAEEMTFPICQDTGMAVVFLEIGNEVLFTNGFIIESVNKGIENAYKNSYLRKSVVIDPLHDRKNSNNNLPAIIHTDLVKGDKLKISVMPKGFGSENQSGLKMFTPSSTSSDIVDFIVNGVIKSGGKGCPPAVLGIGIGGDFEYSALLSKKALLIPLDDKNPDPFYAEMENEIKAQLNSTNIGAMGLPGKINCLGVKILTYPTHIAGLPVAYNYSCHASRHKSIVI